VSAQRNIGAQNVTSPTGIQKIDRFDGVHLDRTIWDRIEAKVSVR
jgi:glutathione synthase